MTARTVCHLEGVPHAFADTIPVAESAAEFRTLRDAPGVTLEIFTGGGIVIRCARSCLMPASRAAQSR